MKFSYIAFDASGSRRQESIEAPDIAEASEILRKRGLFVSEIRPESGGPARSAERRPMLGAGRRLKNLAIFVRQLAVLVSTGTPVVPALAALERQFKDEEWRAVIAGVRKRVEEGSPLAEAMSAYPIYFDPVARSLVAAGESGGRLDSMLTRLAALTRQQQHVRSSVLGALVYPTLLIVVAAAVLTLLITFVLPRFAGLFKTLDTPLPPTTQVLMVISDIVRAYWFIVIPGIILAVVAVVSWAITSAGRRTLDTLSVRLPKVGAITRSFATARIARVLGVLLESRVPLLDALKLTRESVANWHYVALLDRAEGAVTRGQSMSAAFAEGGLVAPSVCEAIRNGEESGQVAPVLLNVAQFLDEDNEVVVRSLSSIMEPIILLVLGLVVGVVAVSMFMPLFDLTAAAGGGS